MTTLLLCLGILITLCMMASAAEIPPERHAARAWFDTAFLQKSVPTPPAPPGLDVRRQDHGEFRLNKSVLNTPLQIGAKRYERGLGTHSVSEIVVRLPRPGKRFEAEVGIDNNYDTAGQRGTVVFVVEVAGKEVFQSPLRKGGQPPLPVRVDLNGATEFALRVLDGGDGPGWDQSDWANAAVTLKDGKRLWLDELPVIAAPAKIATEPPFSFVYDEQPSAQLLPTWKRSHTAQPAANGREKHVITYADPATGLEVICEATMFADYSAVEWVLRLRNAGSADTPILENIRPLDLRITAPSKGDVILHHAHGSTCEPTDFLPIDTMVARNADVQIAPCGGRSSDGALPFFNLEWSGGGLVGAIGWSGQWAMRLRRDAGSELTLRAGQQTTRLKLHPGETIRTPRILVVMWQGDDRLRGHNLLRRLLFAHYVPRHNGEIIVPPVTQNTWFTFNSGNDVTEANQLEAMRDMKPMGVECYWLDAGWFEGGWPSGVGSWVPKADAFPRGLKPLGDAAHKLGMKFVVWFEPERVSPTSRIAKEHPDFVLRAGGGDGLFNLGNPTAREWLTNHLSQRISDSGIDVYRNDFNIDPLRFWQAADAPDRQGMGVHYAEFATCRGGASVPALVEDVTRAGRDAPPLRMPMTWGGCKFCVMHPGMAEIRYVEGLYAMWDELRWRHPGLAIDNCASGGRRIDLETISRSYPLWRSDTQCCGKAMPVQDQVQSAGLSLYVPLHSAGVWDFDPYPFRSVGTTGTNVCVDTRGKDAMMKQAKRAIKEMKDLRPLYLGDYYPLMDINLDEHQWCGWQFDRPELGKGFAVFFRRSQSHYAAVDVSLRGLSPRATYEVTFVDTKKTQRMTGAALAKLRVEIGNAPASALITYRRLSR